MNNIPLDQLEPHKRNGGLFSKIEGDEWINFLASIETRGILQPLLISPSFRSDEKYTIVSGHNRYRAALELQLETLPCEIKEYDTKEDLMIDLISVNLDQRTYTAADRVLLSAELLKIEDDLRIKNGKNKAQNGKFTDSGRSARNGENAESGHSDRSARMYKDGETTISGSSAIYGENSDSTHSGRTARMVKGGRRRERIQARSKASRGEYDLALLLMELPQEQVEQVINKMRKYNMSVKDIKQELLEEKDRVRRLKAQLREEKKIKQTKREMEQMKDFEAAGVDPREKYEADLFDKMNKDINRASEELAGMIAAIFSHGPIRDRTAERLAPGIQALAQIMKDQRKKLISNWQNRSRELEEIDLHNDALKNKEQS